MSERLLATFQYLAKTENEAAQEVLVAGLDYPHRTIRNQALRALLDRRNPEGHREIFRRLASLDEHGREVINERPERLDAAVSEALQQSRPEDCAAACDAIISFRLFGVLPTLISVLTDSQTAHTELLARTARTLAELFYGELSGADDQPKRKQRGNLRDRITGSFEDAVRKFHRHQRPEVIEGLLLLAKPNNATLRQILQRPREASHGPILDFLARSTQGGVIRLLLGLLDDRQMPRVVRKVICNRCDMKFVENLLWSISPRPSISVVPTLARITSVAWATPESPVLDQLDDKAQIGAVQLMLASGIDREQALAVVEHLLLHGKPGGRQAAAEALEHFESAKASELVLQAMEDDEPRVLAAAIGQLRLRKNSNAFSQLVRQIDHPSPEVIQALRKAMPEFTLERFLANLDSMDEELRPTTGHLIRKLDDHIVKKLAAKLVSPSAPMRRRAVFATSAMGLVQELEETMIAMLGDENHMVRAAAAEALADCQSMPTWEALREALLDQSMVVQDAAEQSLARISETLLLPTEEEIPEEIHA